MNSIGNQTVIGGHGVLGSKVAWRLKNQSTEQDKIAVIDNGSSRCVECVNMTSCFDLDVLDVEIEKLRQMFIANDVVYFLAGCRGDAEIETLYEQNVTAAIRVMRAAQEAQVPRVVLASTQQVYGAAACPASGFNVGTALWPVDAYAASNVAMEAAAFAFHQKGLSVTCLRISEVFGAGVRHKRLPSLVASIADTLLSGETLTLAEPHAVLKDFVHVEEVVDAIVAAGMKHSVLPAYDICSGRPRSVYEIASRLAQLYEMRLDYHVDDLLSTEQRLSFGDPRPAMNDLDMKTDRDFASDMKTTATWLKESHEDAQAARAVS